MPEDALSNRFLSKPQRRLVGTALALLSLTLIIAFTFGVFLALRVLVETFSHVLWPLAVAGILALMLRPLVVFMQRRLRFSRTWSIISLYILVAAILLGILAFLLPTIIDQTVRFIKFLPVFIENLRVTIAENYPSFVSYVEENVGPISVADLQQSLYENLVAFLKASQPAVNKIGDIIAGGLAVATGVAIVPVYLFFMLGSDRNLSADLKHELDFIRVDWRNDVVFLINEFIGSIVSFFRGQLVIALIMGALLAIGFTAIGLNFAIILGLGIGLLNVVPYLGSIIGLSTVLPLAYFQGDSGGLTLVLLALGVFAFVQMVEGYFLTPRIMGQTTGLHPMVIIVAIFFWGTALDGILGMILAIPLTAFFVVAWRLLKRKYLGRRRAAREATA